MDTNLQFATIDNFEVFQVGKWNGKEFTKTDLQGVVDAFNATKNELKPFVKLGHDENQKLLQKDGYPSAGWVDDLKLVGNKIVATVKDVPKVIADLINKKAYARASSEFFVNYKEKYPLAFKAVALLGGDTPAVTSLKDVVALYVQDQEQHEQIVFSFENKNYREDKTMDVETLKQQLEEANAKVAQFSSKQEELKNKEKELKEKEAQFSSELQEAKKIVDEAKTKEVEEFSSKLVEDKKILPAQKEQVKEILNYTIRNKELKFTENSSDSLHDNLVKFFSEMQKFSIEGKVSKTGEKKEPVKNYTEAQREKMISEFAKKDGITVKEAIIKYSAELYGDNEIETIESEEK